MPSPEEFLCAAESSLGWAFGCSRTGASHIRNGRPCEDSFAIFSGSAGAVPCIALAVADGHGDPRHDRSRTGSAIATFSAVEELVEFHRNFPDNASGHSIRNEFRADFGRRVSRRWREAVMSDAVNKGDTIDDAGESAGTVYTRYGSTLISALVVADTILVGQIGDGDIVLVRPDGTLEFPIPPDQSLLGTETRSLSSRDAHLLFRTATLDRDAGGVLIAATDGVSDSFDGSEGEEFKKFIRSLSARVDEFGIVNVAGSMKTWLDRYSELASGDDMTIVFACINGSDKESSFTGPDVSANTENSAGGF
jgi:serine/threonine protein phosphatase PrpC